MQRIKVKVFKNHHLGCNKYDCNNQNNLETILAELAKIYVHCLKENANRSKVVTTIAKFNRSIRG